MSAMEYEESNASFNAGIAASLGMSWTQEIGDRNFTVTISKN